MKAISTFLFFLLFSLSSFCQEHKIELKNEPISIQLGKYYIKEVVDARKSQEHLGIVRTGFFNKKVPARFNKGLENAIFTYLENGLKSNAWAIPVGIRITHLQISEKMNYSSETARAYIRVEFYKYNGKDQHTIYETSTTVEEAAFDVTKSHEKRIREAIKWCLNDFANTDHKSATVSYFSETEEVQIKNKPDVVSSTSNNDKTATSNSHLTLYTTQGKNATGVGLLYEGYSASKQLNWYIPWSISFERFYVDPDQFQQSKYHSVRWNYFMPGISAYRKITDRIHANFTFQLPFGTEALTDFSDQNTTHFVIGLAPYQGLHFVPKSDTGVTFGIGFYQRVFTSEFYNRDIGIKANFGIKF